MARDLSRRRVLRNRFGTTVKLLDIVLSLILALVTGIMPAVREVAATTSASILNVSHVQLVVTALAIAVIWPVVLSSGGVYRHWSVRPVRMVRLTGCILVATLLLAGVLKFAGLHIQHAALQQLAFGSSALLIGCRLALTGVIPGWLKHRRVLVVGTGSQALLVAKRMAVRRDEDLVLAGIARLDVVNPPVEPDVSASWLPWHDTSVAALPDLVLALHADLVVLAPGSSEQQFIQPLVSSLAHLPVVLDLLPESNSFAETPSPLMLVGMPAIGLTESAIVGMAAVAKRTIDIVVSLLAIVAGMPLMLLIAAAVRLDSPGPVDFSTDESRQAWARIHDVQIPVDVCR